MENEVFRTITISGSCGLLEKAGATYEIFAEDKHSFLLFILFPYEGNGVSVTKMYESRWEGSKLSWIHMMNVEEPHYYGIISSPPPLWMRRHCVVLNSLNFLGRKELIVYDYRARELIGRFELPVRSDVVDCFNSELASFVCFS